MTGKIRALVLTGFGLNCDLETAHALELAGAEAERVHINALIDGSARLDDYQILAFGGGFSWGDDHGAGVLQAVRLRTNIGDQLRAFVASGRLVIGICNGFQTLVNLGLLPGLDGDYQTRSVALTFNDCGNFRDDWVTMRLDGQGPCVFTRGMEIMDLPIRHGEGKFYATPEVIANLERHHQIAACYAKPDGAPAADIIPIVSFLLDSSAPAQPQAPRLVTPSAGPGDNRTADICPIAAPKSRQAATSTSAEVTR